MEQPHALATPAPGAPAAVGGAQDSRVYVVDTHAIVWYLEGNPRLSTAVGAILDRPESRLAVPIIALAEACWVVEAGRTGVPSRAVLLRDVCSDPRISVLPLDRETLDLSLGLTTVGEMHDRLIVASALRLASGGFEVVLLTRDAAIRQSGLVATLW